VIPFSSVQITQSVQSKLVGNLHFAEHKPSNAAAEIRVVFM